MANIGETINKYKNAANAGENTEENVIAGLFTLKDFEILNDNETKLVNAYQYESGVI